MQTGCRGAAGSDLETEQPPSLSCFVCAGPGSLSAPEQCQGSVKCHRQEATPHKDLPPLAKLRSVLKGQILIQWVL